MKIKTLKSVGPMATLYRSELSALMSKLLLAGWFEVRPQHYNFHSAKQPIIQNLEQEKLLMSDQYRVAMVIRLQEEHNLLFIRFEF